MDGGVVLGGGEIHGSILINMGMAHKIQEGGGERDRFGGGQNGVW